MFSTLHKTNFKFSVTFILSSANAFNLDKPKMLSYGNELIWRSFQSFRKYIFSPFYTFLKQLSFSPIVCIVPEFSDDDRVSLLDKTPIGYLDWCYVMVYIDTFIRGNRKERIRKKKTDFFRSLPFEKTKGFPRSRFFQDLD